MQLKLALLESTELPTGSASLPLPTAWNQLDEAARIAALRKLAVLIARMLATKPAEESGNE